MTRIRSTPAGRSLPGNTGTPNPSIGPVKISANQNARIMIFSMLGQTILVEISIAGNEVCQLDVRNLPGGIYLIQSRGQTRRNVRKLIIQK